MGLAEAGRQLEVGVEIDSIGWMYQGSRACCILYYYVLEIRMPENEPRGPRRIRGIPAKAYQSIEMSNARSGMADGG